MPLENILYLSFVISALAVFATALAYAEWATRQLNNESFKAARNRRLAQRQHEETAPLRRAA